MLKQCKYFTFCYLCGIFFCWPGWKWCHFLVHPV